MNSKYNNVIYDTDSPLNELTEAVLHDFFSKNEISLGTLIRKIPYVLMDLTALTRTTWHFSCLYDFNTASYTASLNSDETISFNDELVPLKVYIRMPEYPRKNGTVVGRNLVQNFFKNNKWLKYSQATYFEVLIERRYDSCKLNCKLHNDTDMYISSEYIPLSLTERFANMVHDLFHKRDDNCVLRHIPLLILNRISE